MKSRILVTITGVLVLAVLLAGACSAGFIVGRAMDISGEAGIAQGPVIPNLRDGLLGSGSNTAEAAGTPDELEELFAPFWQAWDLVHKQYVDQPVDDVELMRGAIQGMLNALGDQHTSYLNPENYEQANAHLEGEEYQGIGAWVDITGDYLTIISPMPNSPAEEAGLMPGDQVIAVDGEDVTGIDGEQDRQRIIGPEGTTVVLTIQREGEDEPFDVEVRRAKIVVPSVDGEMLENQIAYVRLFTFGADTANELHRTLRELLAENPQGLILDLRNNGGGYLDTAIDVASEFIGDGVIMYEVHADGSETIFDARRGGLATKIPLVVLINEGSASASEIVAGAIQDHDRGKLVGMTSFGKGSVQNYTPLVNNQGAVRITIARWLTPDKRQIHEVGLEPDVTVEITEEDFAEGKDPQLDAAIDLLLQEQQ